MPTPSREQIADAIHETYEDEYGLPAPGTFEDCADAVLALLQPHTIDTVEEARGLPDGTVLVHTDRHGVTAYVIGDGYIRHTGNDYWNGEFEHIEFPATVVWSPEEAGQ